MIKDLVLKFGLATSCAMVAQYTLIQQLLSGCNIDRGRFSKLSYPSFDDLNHIQNYIDELKEK